MYTGEPVIIDNLFLRNKMLQSGIVINCSSESIKVWDSQGTQYGVLQPGEASSITLLVPTRTTFHWIPSENEKRYRRNAQKYAFEIDQKDNQYWKGEPIGWKVQIFRSR